MNFTIIGHTEDQSYHDRCGDYISQPGKFETHFFREDQKAEFLREWAFHTFHNTYENLLILINGVPEERMNDIEFEQFEGFEREMDDLYPIIKAEHEAAEKIRKDAAAEAALAKARKIQADQRARDLAQLEALQKKLGVK